MIINEDFKNFEIVPKNRWKKRIAKEALVITSFLMLAFLCFIGAANGSNFCMMIFACIPYLYLSYLIIRIFIWGLRIISK